MKIKLFKDWFAHDGKYYRKGEHDVPASYKDHLPPRCEVIKEPKAPAKGDEPKAPAKGDEPKAPAKGDEPKGDELKAILSGDNKSKK